MKKKLLINILLILFLLTGSRASLAGNDAAYFCEKFDLDSYIEHLEKKGAFSSAPPVSSTEALAGDPATKEFNSFRKAARISDFNKLAGDPFAQFLAQHIAAEKMNIRHTPLFNAEKPFDKYVQGPPTYESNTAALRKFGIDVEKVLHAHTLNKLKTWGMFSTTLVDIDGDGTDEVRFIYSSYPFYGSGEHNYFFKKNSDGAYKLIDSAFEDGEKYLSQIYFMKYLGRVYMIMESFDDPIIFKVYKFENGCYKKAFSFIVNYDRIEISADDNEICRTFGQRAPGMIKKLGKPELIDWNTGKSFDPAAMFPDLGCRAAKAFYRDIKSSRIDFDNDGTDEFFFRIGYNGDSSVVTSYLVMKDSIEVNINKKYKVDWFCESKPQAASYNLFGNEDCYFENIGGKNYFALIKMGDDHNGITDLIINIYLAQVDKIEKIGKVNISFKPSITLINK